jgi:LacI family transcriptional regulator
LGKPTIDDVAALSGVARATVSRVLNSGPNVRDEVRARVMVAVEKLQYKVNLQARFLAGGKSQVLGLIYESDLNSEPNSFYHSGLEIGALRACAETGFQLLLHSINPNGSNMAARIIELVESKRCDGLILTPPFSDDVQLLQAIAKRQCAVVCVSAGRVAQSFASGVGIDDEAAGFEITRYVIGLGHRRLGFIKGLEGHLSAEERYSGFRRAVSQASLDESDMVIERGDFTFRSGADKSLPILNSAKRPTALICANDDMAVGAMFAAHKMGLSIPDDLTIVGFDDTPVSEIIWPPLTTVRQPLKDIGARAVRMLVDQIKANRPAEAAVPPSFEFIGHRIVVRESASAPKI